MSAPAANPQPRASPAAGRRAFTLIELLVTMVIIAILSAMVLAGLSAATESAKHAKTKATIAKIHGQLAQHWAAYETRRVALPPVPSEPPLMFETRRLLALWELQRVELPDTYEDIYFNPAFATNNALQAAYRATAPIANRALYEAQYASAECLYMIVMLGMNDGDEVRFLESEIGDKDQDGMPEFIDGWGRPIEFIRWAPGYVPRLGADTDIQRDDPPGSAAPYGFQGDSFDRRNLCRPGGNGPAALNPPPGQPANSQYYGFKLMPLVYSLGPDGEAGMAEPTDPNRAWHPYAYYPEGTPTYLPPNMADKPRGTPIVGLEGGGHLDNITNHRLGTR